MRPVNQFATVIKKRRRRHHHQGKHALQNPAKDQDAKGARISHFACGCGRRKKTLRTPKRTWAWEPPIWVAAGHIRRHTCTPLDADEVSLAQQVDLSDAATAPYAIGRATHRLMKTCDACPPDYVAAPLPSRSDSYSPVRTRVPTASLPTGMRLTSVQPARRPQILEPRQQSAYAR